LRLDQVSKRCTETFTPKTIARLEAEAALDAEIATLRVQVAALEADPVNNKTAIANALGSIQEKLGDPRHLTRRLGGGKDRSQAPAILPPGWYHIEIGFAGTMPGSQSATLT
jgi:hypothetical protein